MLLNQAETMRQGQRDVVVTGLGAVSPFGLGVDCLWRALLAGRYGITPLTRVNPELHRIRHAGQVPDFECELPCSRIDPALKFAVTACREAFDDAALPEDLPVALVLGTNFGAMAATQRLLESIDAPVAAALAGGPSRLVAEDLKLHGPVETISLSCASGNAAIGRAADLIRSGSVEAAIAGGYDAICETVWSGLSALRAMTSNVIRPFDKRRDGTIFSEGAGTMLLESAEHAAARGARIYARFLGYATSSNAYHMTHPDPDGAGMARAMLGALNDAALPPERVDHINAHATGTPSNDKLETAAIKSVFGERARRIPICGIKSMLGHLMGAASAIEAIATVLTIRDGIIPPTINLEEPDPECDLDYVPGVARKVDVSVALNNSAGFGGCNASVIFGKAT